MSLSLDMTWFNNIIRTGIIDTDDYPRKRAMILSNYIAIILCAGLCLLMVNRLIFFDEHLYNIFAMGLILFVLPILLNKFAYTTISRLLLCYAPIVLIWYSFIMRMREMTTIDQSTYDGLRIFLLCVCFIPYLLFDKSRVWVLIVGIFPTLISILCFGFILRSVGLLEEPVGSITDDYQLMPIRTFVAYVVISISCFSFQTIIGENDKFNRRLLSELKNRTEEIEAQNEMLTQSQLRMHEMNQHLESLVDEKTQNIKRQNEILMSYAYTNAHHVRGPVARVLGLITLSKLDTDLSYPWLFEKIEQETNEIDRIIKRISEDLNDGGGMDASEEKR